MAAKLKGKYRDFSSIPLPNIYIVSLNINTPTEWHICYNSLLHLIITRSSQFPLGITPRVVHSMDLDECIMISIHHYASRVFSLIVFQTLNIRQQKTVNETWKRRSKPEEAGPSLLTRKNFQAWCRALKTPWAETRGSIICMATRVSIAGEGNAPGEISDIYSELPHEYSARFWAAHVREILEHVKENIQKD